MKVVLFCGGFGTRQNSTTFIAASSRGPQC